MKERRTSTTESRKKSSDKRSEAKKRLDGQRRSGENIAKVMKQVAELGTTGFSDTDQKVVHGAEKIGKSAERVGQEDAKVTHSAADDVSTHGSDMEKLASQAASEGAKAGRIQSSDSRVPDAQKLRAEYKEAESVASDISKGDKRAATTTRTEAKSIVERVKSDSRKRPSFR